MANPSFNMDRRDRNRASQLIPVPKGTGVVFFFITIPAL